jgi:hypothetical protein
VVRPVKITLAGPKPRDIFCANKLIDMDIFHLAGEPRERGISYGRSLKEIFPRQFTLWIDKGMAAHGILDRERLTQEAHRFLDKLPRHFVEELEGFAKGAQVPVLHVAAWQCEYLARTGCSTLVTQPDGIPWVGHTVDYDNFGAHQWACVVIVDASDSVRLPFMHFPIRGDLGVYQGVNAARLWLHTNYLPAIDVPCRPSLPWLFWVREALETCTSLADIEAFLNTYDRDTGVALTAIDGKTNEATIFECSRSTFRRLPAQAQALSVTNHAQSGGTEEAFLPPSVGSLRRLARLQELVTHHMPCQEEDFVQILSDPKVEQRGEWLGTVQAVIACPSSRKVWYAAGHYPAASQGQFTSISWPWK